MAYTTFNYFEAIRESGKLLRVDDYPHPCLGQVVEVWEWDGHGGFFVVYGDDREVAYQVEQEWIDRVKEIEFDLFNSAAYSGELNTLVEEIDHEKNFGREEEED